MNSVFDHLKILSFNVGSWMATLTSVAFAKDFLQILCLVGSLCVSAYSVWWIRKQAKALDNKSQKPQ